MRSKAINIFLVCVVALVSAGCGSDEPTTMEAREISFTGLTDQSQRTRATLDPAYYMWVSALYHNENRERFWYYSDMMYVYSDVLDSWRRIPPIFYPLNGELDFFGYAVQTLTHRPKVEYFTSLPMDYKGEEDPELSMVKLDFTQASKPLNAKDDVLASVVNKGVKCGHEAPKKAQLDFVHLMTCVRFVFSSETEEASKYLRITGIEINNVSMSGICTLTPDEEKGGWEIGWSDLTDATTINEATTIYPAIPDPNTDMPYVDFYVPAQNVIKGGGNPSVRFKLKFRYGSNVSKFTSEMTYMDKLFPSTTRWEPGHRYIYTINCKMLPHIQFRISVSEEDENGIMLDPWEEHDIPL